MPSCSCRSRRRRFSRRSRAIAPSTRPRSSRSGPACPGAAGRWPSDRRFTKPLAMLYATFGKGREAVRTIERYLSDQPDDADALYVALEWLYHVRSAGAVVHNKAEDLKLAQTYAADYERLGGKQIPLVKQWLGFLQNDR